jgi:hypothetical protein
MLPTLLAFVGFTDFFEFSNCFLTLLRFCRYDGKQFLNVFNYGNNISRRSGKGAK